VRRRHAWQYVPAPGAIRLPKRETPRRYQACTVSQFGQRTEADTGASKR
jgi:hypothetical protein